MLNNQHEGTASVYNKGLQKDLSLLYDRLICENEEALSCLSGVR